LQREKEEKTNETWQPRKREHLEGWYKDGYLKSVLMIGTLGAYAGTVYQSLGRIQYEEQLCPISSHCHFYPIPNPQTLLKSIQNPTTMQALTLILSLALFTLATSLPIPDINESALAKKGDSVADWRLYGSLPTRETYCPYC